MNIIDQLEQTVTPAILGANSSVAHVGLLEQFYAILASRLAVPEIYTQLQRADSLMEPSASSILFEQLWQQPSQRHLLIQELAATYHIDETTTGQLVTNAAHLAYQELKNLANGQFLPAFLQAQQSAIRHYLPAWASAVIAPVVAVVTEKVALPSEVLIYDNHQAPHAADDVPVILKVNDGPSVPIATNAIHANPSAHHTPDMHAGVCSRNQRHDLLVRSLLLGGLILAMAVIWALFFRDKDEPMPPVAVAPIVTVPKTVTLPQVLIPAQLMVGVDDSGNLYTCTAIVGDVNLQTSLRQALMVSFGEQANSCDVTVQDGVATTLTNMNIATLPDVLTLIRAVPFSRLQLQNDSISIEAPDDILLQRLLVDVRTLVPTMTSAAPVAIVQPPANTYDDTYNNSNYNDSIYNNNGVMPNNGNPALSSDNNVLTNVEPAPPPQSSINNSNNMPQNNQPVQPSGPMSLAEADAIANTTIVSEPAQGGRSIKTAKEDSTRH